MVGDEQIERVEVGARHPVHLDHAPALDAQRRRGVIGAIGHRQPGLGPRLDEGLLIDGSPGQNLEAA